MKIELRLGTPADYRAVEEVTREAFWINTDCRPYIDEHLLAHKLRQTSAFVPELDYVAEVQGNIVGSIVYSKAKIVESPGKEHQVLTFGPLSVLPQFQNKGIGKMLVDVTTAKARELGYTAIAIFGHPDYYPRLGFRPAAEFGLETSGGRTFPAFMAMELKQGALQGMQGQFHEDAVFGSLQKEEVLAFDQGFPQKAPRPKIPMEVLLARLEPKARESLQRFRLTYLGEMRRVSEGEVSRLPGLDGKALETIRSTMKEHGRTWGAPTE